MTEETGIKVSSDEPNLPNEAPQTRQRYGTRYPLQLETLIYQNRLPKFQNTLIRIYQSLLILTML